MKNHNTFSLKGRQTRIVLYLLMAIIAVIVSFSVAGAWFMDKDKTDSEMPMGSAVIVKLVGTGEDGAIQNFKELYNSDGGAYPGDKILDSIKVQMGENTEESVLRVQYAVNILDADKNVKTENLTESETKLVEMLESDLKSITTLYSSDWAQTSSDWIYYKHLASGKTKPIELFDEYSLPLPDAQMDNSYQELSFRISLVAEAIQAANIMSFDEWNNDITNLSDSALIERVIKYNGERFADVDEVLPYIETTGGQYIDTGYVANLNTAVETTFQTNANNVWLFGSRTSGGASNTYAVHVSSMNTIWFQMANDSSSTQFSVGNIEDKQSTLTVNKDAAYLNGTQIGTVGRTSFGNNTLSLYLGVINANGSGTDRPFVGKIYSMRIWDNGQLVRFFVPARDKEGNVGFYDLVTKDMYLNEGTGSFAYGHSINYVANGGTIDANASKTFESSDLPITLPTPTRTGYEFGGWFLSSNFSGAAQTTIPAGTDNNVYLYAKWIKTYKITYHLGGGENAESNPQTFNEKTLPLTLAAPTREGFTFGGWYQNPAYSGSQATTIEIGTEKNVSLWAKWDAIEYSITYILNGGTNSDQNVTKFTILDTPVKLFNPTYEGYVFEGWFASSDFSGERKTYLSKDNFGDITLYAKWSLAYTITYNTNGGLNDGRNPSVFTESTETFTLYGATKVNFTFLGWFDNEELSGTPITQITKGTKKNIVLWAKWSSTQITVTFDPNGGGVSPVTKVVKKGGTYVELPIPTKAGYTFDGWFTEVDGGTQVLPTSTVISDADHTLFAHWTENVYTVTYNLDGGTNAAGNPATFKRSDLPIVLLDATKDGAYFAGWYTDADFTKRVTKIDAGSLKNVELWARFSSSPLVFDLVGTSAYSVRAANATISGDIEIPATYNGKPVVVIQNYGFKDCANLTSISIPSSVKSIGINAFENCSSIAEVVIPEGVILVANNTFLECANLASVTLPATLENIGANAFSGCTSLTTIVLPKNIEEIGANAFANCSTLDVIEVFGDTPATLKTGVFPNNISKIYVKPSLVSTYKTAWTEYKDKIFGFLEYTITYNLDGGTNDDRNVASFTKIDLPITLYAPTKENADFLGWYAASDFSSEKVTKITTASNVTLYARWDRKMTITYVLNGGKNNASNLSTITENMLPYSLMPADKDNYTFIGWFLDDALTNQISSITNFGDITIYAAWEELNPYLVFTLNTDNTAYSVKASSTGVEGAIKIPSIYRGKPVTTIESNGFANCSKMTDLYIPSSVTSIGSSAFSNCSGDLLIYSDVTSQPSGWSYSANIYGVKGLPTSNDEWKYVEKLDGALIAVKYLGNSTNVQIPNSIDEKNVVQIYDNCFKDKSKIISIEIPNSITDIGSNAFQNCSSMKRIYIPSSVTTITAPSGYSGPFFGWNSSAVIYCEAESEPSGWGNYWNYYNSSNRLSVVWNVAGLPQQNEEWEYVEKTDGTIRIAKYLGSSSNVTIPSILSNKTVSELYNNCFMDNTTISSVVIPVGVTSIGSNAFYGCSGLTSINIPDGVTSIEDSTFYNCSGLNSITLPKGVINIGNYAFSGCSGLTSIVLSNKLTNIGNNAFENCTSMRKIYIPISVTTISASSYSNSPFYGWNSSAEIYCGAASEPSGWGTYWNYYNSSNRLATIWSVAGLPQQNLDWIYIEKIDGTIRVEKYLGTAKDVSVPEMLSGKIVDEISEDCFKANTSIVSISMSNNVIKIDANAFSDCSELASITLSSKLEKINEKTFQNCSKLISIIIPASVTSIGSSAFSGCNALESMTIPFVGRSATSTSYEGVFGYIFGFSVSYESTGTLTSIDTSFSTSVVGERSDAYCQWTDRTYKYQRGSWTYYRYKSYWYFIPSSLKNVTVTGGSINTAAFCRIPNINVTLNGVDRIGDYAFYESKITSITIPSSVTSIGSSAFNGCSGLTRVNISDLTAWFKITFSGSASNPLYYAHHLYLNNTELKEITIPSSITQINDNVLAGASVITSVTIPNSVTSIGSFAFSGCTAMTRIYVPSGVTIISASSYSYSPFYGWDSSAIIYCGAASKPSGWGNYWNNYDSSRQLKVVWNIAGFEQNSEWEYLEKNDGTMGILKYLGQAVEVLVPLTLSGKIVDEIYDNCFMDNATITSITIPNSVTSIGNSAFYGCSGLTKVNISDITAWFKITFDNEYANPLNYAHHLYLNGTELTEIIVPSSITQINSYALYGASAITSITIPSGATSIGNSAFYGCNVLATFTIPFVGESSSDNNYLGYIFGASSYSGNSSYVPSSLKTVVVTGGMSIASNAFYKCSSLTSITIPSSVTSIGNYAFYNCSGLNSITLPNGVTSIGNSAFAGCSGFTTITIPSSVTSIGSGALYGCSALSELTIPFVDNYLGYIFGASSYSGNSSYVPSSLKTVVVTGGTLIENYAFSSCSNLTSITITGSVTSIGYCAFYRCSSLTSINIPESVVSIASNAFENCTSMRKMYIPSSVTTISMSSYSSSPFYGWNSSAIIYCGASSKPDGWGSYWNCCSLNKLLTVRWGQTGLPS